MIILGRSLQRLRLESGMSQAQVAKRSRFSEAKLSAIENGKQRVTLFDVAGLCRVMRASPELTSQLERMSDEVDNPSWWEPYSTYMLRDFAMFLDLEQTCSELLIYESELITGLLQTEAYARAIHAVGPVLDQEGIEQAVELRAQRQERFWARTNPPKTIIIMHESALTRQVCDSDAEQRHAIINRARSADIRVLPANPGAHPSMKGAYTILTSGIDEISDAVYTETITGARYEANAEVIDLCRMFFESTYKRSIPVEEFFS